MGVAVDGEGPGLHKWAIPAVIHICIVNIEYMQGIAGMIDSVRLLTPGLSCAWIR